MIVFHPQTQFNCSLDKDRSVYRMVSSGMGVWLSLQSSAVIRLFHATRYECLADVDVAPPVHKMLAGKYARALKSCIVVGPKGCSM